jgi:hypothetical protein
VRALEFEPVQGRVDDCDIDACVAADAELINDRNIAHVVWLRDQGAVQRGTEVGVMHQTNLTSSRRQMWSSRKTRS